MFPLGDENSGSGFPAPATLAIIALNLAAFVLRPLSTFEALTGSGGVALAAHVGGFAAGAQLVSRFPQTENVHDEYERRTDE